MRKWLVGGFISLFVVAGAVGIGFYMTGGSSLVNTYNNYLDKDIPDKKYSWDDFTDRGPGRNISGYYAGSINENIFMWTLSGLKRYVHSEGLSVYYYVDTCAVIRELDSHNQDGESKSEKPRTREINSKLFSFTDWRQLVKTGDYVWVRWADIGDKVRVIDKIYGSSNQNYPLDKITVEECRK